MIDRFEKMEVWQLAHQLALATYRSTIKFPAYERYGLVAQIRRAAIAIPTNLVEGGSRGHRREYLQFCYIARGSSSELRYLFRVARDLAYFSNDEWEALNTMVERVAQMLNGLIRALRATS